MADKAKRSSRFDVVSRLFMGYESGNQTLDQVQKNLELLGYFISSTEIPKFAEQYPDLDIEKVSAFLVEVGAFKEPKTKKSTATGGARTSLNTVEGAVARGVASENIPAYIEAVNRIYADCKIINSFATKAHSSFAIPMTKPKEVKEVAAGTVTEG